MQMEVHNNNIFQTKNAASPMVNNESVFITAAVDIRKRRNVVTLDIPEVYLHTDKEEEEVMLLKERLAELMVQMDPKLYHKYVITNTIICKNEEGIICDAHDCLTVLLKFYEGPEGLWF